MTTDPPFHSRWRWPFVLRGTYDALAANEHTNRAAATELIARTIRENERLTERNRHLNRRCDDLEALLAETVNELRWANDDLARYQAGQ